MPQALIPTPKQRAAIEQMIADPGPGAINASDTGCGKTVCGVEVILGRWSSRSLIAGPLSTWDNWRDTMRAQSGGQEELLPVGNTKIASDVVTRQARENLERMLAGEPGHYFMGRELFVSLDWETVEDPKRIDPKTGQPKKRRKQKKVYERHPFDVMVYDEAHASASAKSNGFKTFRRPIAEYKVAASATWFASKLDNMWTLPFAIWGEEVDTFWNWKYRWFNLEYDHFAYDKKRIVGEKIPGRFVTSLPTYIRILSDHKHPVPEVRWVDLSPTERRVYDSLDENYAAKVNSGEWIVAELPVEAQIRMRQATLGPLEIRDDLVFFDPDGKSSKYAELVKYLKEYPDEPVLVGTDSAKWAEVATAWLQRDGFSAGLWAGLSRTPAKDRDALKASFLAGETRVIVMVIAAGGTGTDGLQSVCNRMVIASEDQGEMNRTQFIGRLART